MGFRNVAKNVTSLLLTATNRFDIGLRLSHSVKKLKSQPADLVKSLANIRIGKSVEKPAELPWAG